jgi:hypothetical protein
VSTIPAREFFAEYDNHRASELYFDPAIANVAEQVTRDAGENPRYTRLPTPPAVQGFQTDKYGVPVRVVWAWDPMEDLVVVRADAAIDK